MRWTVIEQSVDCRNADERNPNSESYIPKSRYSAMNHYISDHEFVKDEHMDTMPIKYLNEYKETLIKEGLSERLAEHVARIFTRDPVPAYEGEFIEDQIDDENIVSHFENVQSTNWNSMRFKPPPSQDSKIGWRVEFRTMDIQLTDFENTCLIVLLGLLTNVCNHLNVNFIMPISMVDANMDRAHNRDALTTTKFWFNVNCFDKNNIESDLTKHDSLKSSDNSQNLIEPKFEELYIHEILNGKGDFPGMLNLIRIFMDMRDYSEEHKNQIEVMFDFINARSKGAIPTGA